MINFKTITTLILICISLSGCADYAYNRGCWSPKDANGKCR